MVVTRNSDPSIDGELVVSNLTCASYNSGYVILLKCYFKSILKSRWFHRHFSTTRKRL